MNCEIETELERVNYFQGQLLSVADLQVEQEYFLARLRRHNRYMLGWGVVSGLTVTTASSTEFIVEPGLAVDCVGNEIHMCAGVSFQLHAFPTHNSWLSGTQRPRRRRYQLRQSRRARPAVN
jgi:hypothetical protein